MTSGIKFENEVIHDRTQLVEHWGRYFSILYSPNDTPEYDESFKQKVNNVVEHKMKDISTDKNVRILPEEVCNVIEILPLNEASGKDGIVYEHLIFS
jgi:hypothetical protein